MKPESLSGLTTPELDFILDSLQGKVSMRPGGPFTAQDTLSLIAKLKREQKARQVAIPENWRELATAHAAEQGITYCADSIEIQRRRNEEARREEQLQARERRRAATEFAQLDADEALAKLGL